MKLINKENKEMFVLKGFFEEEKLKMKNILTTKSSITEYIEKNVAYICLGSEKTYDLETLKEIINKIVKLNTRDYQIDAQSLDRKSVV